MPRIFTTKARGHSVIAAGLTALVGHASAVPVAKDYFDSYTNGALAGQGTEANGWAGPWVEQETGLSWNVISDGGTDMNYTPSGGSTIPTGTHKLRLASLPGDANGPLATRQLYVPQTGTIHAAIALRFKSGGVNSGDTFGFYLGLDPADMSTGVNVCYSGSVASGHRFQIRKGSNVLAQTPLAGNTYSSGAPPRNNLFYLIIKVEKDGSANYNKVTLWKAPTANSESNIPDGNLQVIEDLGIDTISQLGLLAENFNQTSTGDQDDNVRLDSLAIATTYAELTAPAALGPPNDPPDTVQVETLADGSGVVVPTQSIAAPTPLSVYSIWRDSGGAFLENGVATTWALTDITGGIQPADLVPSGDGRSATLQSTSTGSARILANVPGSSTLVSSGVITILPPPPPERPFIWVREEDRAGILAKIAANTWATSVRDGIKARADAAVASHQADRDGYLREIPADWTLGTPAMKTIGPSSESTVRGPLESKLNNALDCAVLYYLTEDDDYASCAADILHNVVTTLLPVAPSTSVGNGGWVWRSDYLKEARVTGTQMPIIYDFLYDWVTTANTVYDVGTTSNVAFVTADAQSVFRTLYELGRDHGNSGTSNWSALEATCIVNCALAMDDAIERAEALEMAVYDGSSRQISITQHYAEYLPEGNIWPESLQYTNAVANIMSYLMVLLDRYDPAFDLVATLPNIPRSLPRTSYLVYPNGNEQISFGDGKRPGGSQPYFSYEVMYQHAKATGDTDSQAFFGPLIAGGVSAGELDRSVALSYSSLGRHNEPLQLLWFSPTIDEAPTPLTLPRTDELPYAGIALQRNLSPTGDPDHALMGFVGGAAHIHSHASGMSMELYGLGEVMGAKSGRSTYGTSLHNNYYRLFASNNTVVVNGESRGSGGWQNIAINTVQTVAMEPEPFENAVSDNFSFTCSTFNDNKGNLAEATQQRTLAIIRTSPTTGFYVDLFRSDSSLAGEYHDYIYRNIGASLDLVSGGSTLATSPDPGRFQNDIGDSYEQPGWRYFSNTEVSAPTTDAVSASFTATPSGRPTLVMDAHTPPGITREYATVTAPPIPDAPDPYDELDSEAIVVRKNGEAWDEPFLFVYEPSLASASPTIQSVSHLMNGGTVVGVKVESLVDGDETVHFVFSNPNDNETYTDTSLGLSFTGRFGVVADSGDGTLALYLGQGSELSYQGYSMSTVSGSSSQAEVLFVPGEAPAVTSNTPVNVTGGPVTPTGFASWVTGTFTNGPLPEDRQGPFDDFDGDGVVNLLEYAVDGEDPTVTNPTIGTFDGVTLSFAKRADTSDLIYAIIESTDLGQSDSWEEVTGGGYVNSATTISFTLSGSLPKDYLRLRVSLK